MLITGRRQSQHRKAEYRRLGKKSREHQFVETLEREFELSPRESHGVMEVAKEILVERSDKKDGQVQYTCVRREEGAGKKMEEMKKVEVLLTPIEGSDYRVQEEHGDGAMRKVQLLRMTEEAYDQGGLLTEEDIGRLLHVSSRTVRRDVSEVMKDNIQVLFRGLHHDIGKGISHKAWIVQLYLEQRTYTEIERLSRHSIEAIRIYLSDFNRVLAALEKGITEVKEIAFFIGRSERLVMEYLRLVKEAQGDARQRESLQRLKGRLMSGAKGQITPKKKDYTMVWRLA
jgi:AraC-like DNA-binding protein